MTAEPAGFSHAIRLLSPAEAEARRAALEDLLVDAVTGGASVNFVWPMTHDKAARWWAGAFASQARGERLIFTAETASGHIDGTVQLIPAAQENQPHRADLAKMLVHRRARRRGLGAALMRAAEAEARRLGHTLLTLDTEPAATASVSMPARAGSSSARCRVMPCAPMAVRLSRRASSIRCYSSFLQGSDSRRQHGEVPTN